jgi:hypothetical protein
MANSDSVLEKGEQLKAIEPERRRRQLSVELSVVNAGPARNAEVSKPHGIAQAKIDHRRLD